MSIAQKKEALRAREASRDAAAAEFERADAINFWQESMKQRLQNRIDEVVEGEVEWRFGLGGAFGRDKIKLRYLIFDRLKQRLEVHRCTATGKRISPDELHVLEKVVLLHPMAIIICKDKSIKKRPKLSSSSERSPYLTIY